MGDQTFGFGEVLHLTGVPRTRLIHWTQAGLIKAGVREAQGTGHHRVFSFHNLVEVAITNALAQYGIGVATLGRVLTALLTATLPPRATPDQLMLLVGDLARGGVWVGTRDELATELNSAFLINEPVGMLINIGRIRQELSGRVGDAR